MDKEIILKNLNAVFIDTLDNKDIRLTAATTANEVDDWDSLNHVQLVFATEKAFKIKFKASEFQSWKNIGEMVDCIQSKLNKS